MTDINIHKDSRNRGLEVLLYNLEEEVDQTLDNEHRKCKLKVRIPLLFGREFHFQCEFHNKNHLKLSESK